LTDRGFLLLQDIERIVEHEHGRMSNLRVATYNATTKQLVYRTPRALVVNDRRCARCDDASTPMIEITTRDYDDCDAHNNVSVMTTLQHDLFVALDTAAAGSVVSVNEKPQADDANDATFRKMTAERLRDVAIAAKNAVVVRLLTVAANGVDSSSLADDDDNDSSNDTFVSMSLSSTTTTSSLSSSVSSSLYMSSIAIIKNQVTPHSNNTLVA
jgi:hypothetical protein